MRAHSATARLLRPLTQSVHPQTNKNTNATTTHTNPRRPASSWSSCWRRATLWSMARRWLRWRPTLVSNLSDPNFVLRAQSQPGDPWQQPAAEPPLLCGRAMGGGGVGRACLETRGRRVASEPPDELIPPPAPSQASRLVTRAERSLKWPAAPGPKHLANGRAPDCRPAR